MTRSLTHSVDSTRIFQARVSREHERRSQQARAQRATVQAVPRGKQPGSTNERIGNGSNMDRLRARHAAADAASSAADAASASSESLSSAQGEKKAQSEDALQAQVVEQLHQASLQINSQESDEPSVRPHPSKHFVC